MRDADGEVALDGSVGEGLDEYLFYLITQVQNRRVRNFAPTLEALGLSIAHWRALSTVNRIEGCLMSELSEFTTVDRTTLTRTVDQLVDTGLIERRRSAEDRRLVMLQLTDLGRAVFAQAIDGLTAQHAQVLKDVSSDDLRTLRSILQRMLRNIVGDEKAFSQVLHFDR